MAMKKDNDKVCELATVAFELTNPTLSKEVNTKMTQRNITISLQGKQLSFYGTTTSGSFTFSSTFSVLFYYSFSLSFTESSFLSSI
jgi:hypothetical protein